MKNLKALLVLSMLSLFSFTSNSTHVVGGDMQFTQTGPNTYSIILRLYRDCGGASLGNTAPISIFDGVNCGVAANVSLARVPGTITAGSGTGGTLIQFGDECYTPNLCVEEHYYTGNVTLANNPNGYMAQWDLCCRNTTDNLQGQPSSGLYTRIPDPALIGGNTTPKFIDYPADAYMCVGFQKCIDFAATDADGDSLAYRLITPIASFGGGTNCQINSVPWATGYSATPPLSILGPGSSCVIDPVTGCVNSRPARNGAYVVSVVCEEWRNGVKIGETVRDLQYASLRCTFNSKPELVDFETRNVLDFNGDKCLDFLAIDANPGDTFYLEVTSNAYQFGAVSNVPTLTNGFHVFNWINSAGLNKSDSLQNLRKLSSTTFEGVGGVGARFCWNLDDCDILAIDSFYINVVGYSLGCDGSKDTVSKNISLPVRKAEYSYNVPNVFTPNGDGINDEFFLKKDAFDRCFDALSIKVYNRWGQMVYESEDAKFTWDGKDDSGSEVSEGTYFVILQGFYGGKEVTQNFPITLFR
jgi:gliding motility-associated-like protein